MANLRFFFVMFRIGCLLLGLYITMQEAEAVLLRPGDILVNGSNLVRVDPATGNQTLVSPGVVGDVAIGKNGDVFVVDGSVLSRVDPTTGTRTLITAIPFGGDSLAIGLNGDFFVATSNQLIRVNPVTLAQSVIVTVFPDLLRFNGLAGPIEDVEVGPNGDVYFTTGLCCIFKVDPATGIVTHLPPSEHEMNGLAIAPNGDVYAAGEFNGIYTTGFPQVPTQYGFPEVPCAKPVFLCDEFWDVAVAPDGNLYATSQVSGLVRIDRTTGVQTTIVPSFNFSKITIVTPAPPSIVLFALGFGMTLAVIAFRQLESRSIISSRTTDEVGVGSQVRMPS